MAEDKGTEPVDEGMEVVPDAPLADVPTIIPELEDVVSNLATDVSFARKTWKDGSEGATPITAAELNRLEKGVADLTSAVNGLRDSVSQSPLAGAKKFMMKTTKARVTFDAAGGHRCFFAFSSGNSTPWLAVYTQNTVLANIQRLGNVTVEKVSDDVCDITAPQWSMLVIIPLSGTIEITDA